MSQTSSRAKGRASELSAVADVQVDRLPGRKTWSPRATLMFILVSCGVFWGVVVSAVMLLHH